MDQDDLKIAVARLDERVQSLLTDVHNLRDDVQELKTAANIATGRKTLLIGVGGVLMSGLGAGVVKLLEMMDGR